MASISGPTSTRKTGLLYVIVLLIIIGGGGYMFTGGMQVPTNTPPKVPTPTPISQGATAFTVSVSPSLLPSGVPSQ